VSASPTFDAPVTHEPSPELLTKAARLRGIDLNLLPSLYALLHFRNVTMAAAHLSVTQPTMSGDLRRLRRLFGDELLLRAGREYVLTTLARALLPAVSELVARIDATVAVQPGFDPGPAVRSFSIAMSDYTASLLMPTLADRLTSDAPGVRISIHQPGLNPLRQLVRNEFDMMIRLAESPVDEAIRSLFLFEDRWVCIASADNPAVGTSVTLELFERLPHLEAGFGTPPRSNLAEEAYHQIGRQSWVPVSTESPALTPYFVLGTRLVALAPERLVLRSHVASQLKVFAPPFDTPVLREVLYWNRVNDADPAHIWLRQLVADAARALGPSPPWPTLTWPVPSR
jgi:LysR family transcriptional regulator, nod-box dependent transcriptional activator